MKTILSLRRMLAAGVLATGLAAGALQPTAIAQAESTDVPADIAVPEGNRPFLVAHATGVQIYSCNSTSGRPTWGFVAPRANLYGENGQLVATHFGGPTWEARDGSWVVAKRDSGATVDPTAIPWLRLSRVSASAGPDGDRLASTTYIQRTETSGGVAPPKAACNGSTVGTLAEVPYTADYVFWKSADA
jgi:FtsP/CotA-like multicopper oxidase with cupredoxin domain